MILIRNLTCAPWWCAAGMRKITMKTSSKIIVLTLGVLAAAFAFTGFGMPVVGLVGHVAAVLLGLVGLFFFLGNH